MFDGQNLVDRNAMHGGWRVDDGMGQAVDDGRAAPVIIVGLHAGDRFHDYTPTYSDRERAGGGADDLLNFVEHDLLPWVDGRYRTSSAREHRAVGGSSLGGLIAMHALLSRPHLFGRGLVLSPSVQWANNWLLTNVRGRTELPSMRLYLYNGGPADGQANAEALRDALFAKGLRFGRDLFHYTDSSRGHNEEAWRTYFPQGLSAVFPGDIGEERQISARLR
jgi:predicted alpha/beta superfamily hydrolase